MTEVEAARVIFSQFISQWPTLSSGVAYALENGPLTDASATTFARVQIESLEGFQHTFGGPGQRKWERSGWVDVLLVGVTNVGSEALRALGQSVREIYEGKTYGGVVGQGVTFYATTVSAVRNHPEYPTSAVVVARTPFEYLETR